MESGILKFGVPARLFPVYPESCKEQKSISIILAAMVSVRPFAERMLAPLGVKVGKRSAIKCFTEVTLANEVKGLKDRPDGLIMIDSGKTSWSALIEAKVGRSAVEVEQLERYLELAKINNIDAVITVTNELTPAPSLHPTQISKGHIRNVALYHFSWASILTTAFLLATSKDSPFDNHDEAFIVSELIRYLEHPNSGRVPLEQMNQDWPKIVTDVQAGHPIRGKAAEISEMISTWHQEARDIALIMTRKLKEPVSLAVSRNQIASYDAWVDAEIRQFCDQKVTCFDIEVPHAASRITVEADFLRRSLRVSMKLAAPSDRASNSARLNWLLKQLQDADLSKIIVRCITRGKGQNFGAMANEIDPKADEIKNLAEILSFQVEMSSDLGSKFNSRRKFVEAVEELVPLFYENVGQHLQAWLAPPPQIEKESAPEEKAPPSIGVIPVVSLGEQQAAPAVAPPQPPERPAWASEWQRHSTGTE